MYGSTADIQSATAETRRVCCGQTAGWIKMPLGKEVGLDPGHTVLDGDPAPPPKGHSSPIFGHVYCGQPVVHLSYYS